MHPLKHGLNLTDINRIQGRLSRQNLVEHLILGEQHGVPGGFLILSKVSVEVRHVYEATLVDQFLVLLGHNHLAQRLHLYPWLPPIRHNVEIAAGHTQSLARQFELLL